MPFADESFEAITAFNSVQYAADPVTALRELRRVAVPGAAVGVVTWAAAERCETRTVLAAVGALLPAPPPGSGGPFALSAPGALEDLARAAGLAPQHSDEVDVTFDFPELDAALRAHLASGPARKAIEHAGHAATAEAIRGALAGSVQPDGTSRQRNAYRYLIATA